MKSRNAYFLFRIIVMGGLFATGPSCTHYDWSNNASSEIQYNETLDVTASEPLETVVAYEPGRQAPPKAACTTSDFRLHYAPYAPGYTPSDELVERAQTTMKSMSLTEKATEMRGTPNGGGANEIDIFRQPDNGNIRGFQFRDGPRGLNLAAELMNGHDGYATSFPVSMSRGASFDLDLEYKIGQAQGEETLASRNTLMLAPTVNLLRHPAWGRAQETYGEDPFLLGRMGSAYTLGVQTYIPACVKHYIANNIENGRASINSEMDEQTLREIYGRAYEMIIRDAGVACVMAAYNPVNGVKSTENEHILTDVLRTDFEFEGFVLSDWWAMTNGKNPGLQPAAYQSIAVAGILAGMDMELPWALNYDYIEALVPDQVSQKVIDTSVARILQQKYRFKVGDRNSAEMGLVQPTVGFDRNTTSITNNDTHIQLAEEAALKGAVLLKNADQTLPLNTPMTVAVVSTTSQYDLEDIRTSGEVNYAGDVITGDLGSSRVRHDPDKEVSPLEGIKEAAEKQGITVVEDVQAADLVIVVAGLNPGDEGEEYTGAGDRSSFALDVKLESTPQNDLISATAGSKPTVVVLIGGSVIDMPWLNEVDAVLMAWYPGMHGGRAIGKLLFGEVSPGGKLPFTWPVSWDDEPQFTGNPSVPMDYFAGYRYFDQKGIAPLYPFGHGLSYTEFEYLNLEVPCSTVGSDGVVKVKVDVSNRGAVAGDEVVFLFVSYPGATDRKRIKQLKSFYRVHLEPDQTKQVLLPLRVNDLRFYDMQAKKWVIEPGLLEISVGPNAGNLLLSDQTTINP